MDYLLENKFRKLKKIFVMGECIFFSAENASMVFFNFQLDKIRITEVLFDNSLTGSIDKI